MKAKCPICQRTVRIDPLSSKPVLIWHIKDERQCPGSYANVNAKMRVEQ